MALILGRVQSSSTGSGIGYAFIKDNFNISGSCDQYGQFYSANAYFPGYIITASAGGYIKKAHEITSAEWTNKWMTIRLDPAPPSTSCFAGETRVLMADGSAKRIDTVGVGDFVIGSKGAPSRVTEVETPPLGSRALYSFNGGAPFVTSEHPFLTRDGWKSVDPEATAGENDKLDVSQLKLGDRLMVLRSPSIQATSGNLALAQRVETVLEAVPLAALVAVVADPSQTVYNLILEDGHQYFADGFLVHNKGGW